MSAMTDEEKKELARLIVNELIDSNRARWVDPETHHEHHNFIAQMMEETQETVQRRKRVRDRVTGGVLVSVILAVLGAVGAWLFSVISALTKIAGD